MLDAPLLVHLLGEQEPYSALLLVYPLLPEMNLLDLKLLKVED